MVGAPLATVGGVVNAGYAQVISGKTGAVLFKIAGANVGNRTGAAVARPGDLDGDGTWDLVFGAEQLGTGGTVYAVSGKTLLPLGTLQSQFPASGSNRFGCSVDAAGDIDGNGTTDLVVGSKDRHKMAGYVETILIGFAKQ
jgi:hypothetical protein